MRPLRLFFNVITQTYGMTQCARDEYCPVPRPALYGKGGQYVMAYVSTQSAEMLCIDKLSRGEVVARVAIQSGTPTERRELSNLLDKRRRGVLLGIMPELERQVDVLLK